MASVLALLNLLLGHHFKAREIGDAKGGRRRDVRSVTTASHDNAADAGMVVTGVFRVPAARQKDFEPGAEIHWINIDRNADVAEIPGAIAGGDVHATAESNGEVGEVRGRRRRLRAWNRWRSGSSAHPRS
jgi:hypothetical protein